MKKWILLLCGVLFCFFLKAQDYAYSEGGQTIDGSSEKEDLSNYTFQELLDYGSLKEELGDYETALEIFEKAISLDPNSAIAYDNKGSVYIKLGNYSKANKEFTRAIKLNPEFAEAYNHRGIVNFYNNNLSVALHDYTRAIEINPNFAKAYYNRALVYLRYDNKEYAYYDLKIASHLGYTQSEEILFNYCTDQLFKVKKISIDSSKLSQ